MAAEQVSVRAGDDSDSVIGQSLQVTDQPLQMRTRLKDYPARVARVWFVARIQNLQSVEMPQLLQLQEIVIGHVLVSDAQRLQVREQLWEESDHVGRGAPGLQVQVFQLRRANRNHLQVFGLQVHTECQAEEGAGQEVSICRQRVASVDTEAAQVWQ